MKSTGMFKRKCSSNAALGLIDTKRRSNFLVSR